MTRFILAVILLQPALLQDPPESKLQEPRKAEGSKAIPLIVHLHGYGDTAANALKSLAGLADETGAAVLCINGSEKLEGGGWGWDWARDEKRILVEIDRVQKARKIGHVYLAGFSQGGHLTFELGLRHPGAFRGLIPMAGAMATLDDFQTDISFLAKVKGMPVYIIHGTRDTVIPFEEARKA